MAHFSDMPVVSMYMLLVLIFFSGLVFSYFSMPHKM